MTYYSAASAIIEYPISVPHGGDHDLNVLLTRLARGHLSTVEDEYDELKNRVAEEMYAYVGIVK